MKDQWFNLLYHYGVGGAFFAVSLWILFKNEALSWERASDRFLIKGLLFGFFSFLVVHATWIGFALSRA
tara:strand:- start:162 stop:368 length:207 start_codon:yes stop_codon:yes gene_type:complete